MRSVWISDFGVELAKMIPFLEGTDNCGIFHATCEGETNWADFTEAFYKKLGIKTKVNHITSQDVCQYEPGGSKTSGILKSG